MMSNLVGDIDTNCTEPPSADTTASAKDNPTPCDMLSVGA